MVSEILSQIPIYIGHAFFSINVFPIILLFSIGIQKRKHFAWRIVLGFLISVCCSAPFSHGLFTYIMQFTLFVFSSYFSYEISWKEALYSVTCAYAVQHISYCVYLILFRPVHGTPVYAPAYIVCAVCIALLLYWFIGRKLPENGHYDVDIRFSMMSFFLIIMLALGLSIAADTMFNAEENNLYYLCKAYDLICCLFVLWEQMDYKNKLNKQREQDLEKQVRLKQKELFRLRQDDVERINLICHDLKKQLEPLKLFSDEEQQKAYYEQVCKTIQSYDSQVETGSKVLDTLLSQKRLVCMKNNIELTCVADGKKMDFISAVDLYTILGNVIDNAIESVLMVSDEEKKVISTSIWTKGNLLLIQIQNYMENEKINFSEGLPVTTKNAHDGHGYGLKSVRKCVEKYNGSMDITAENHMFSLTIIIPVAK